ncbi:hypothetical protein L2D36_25705 [Vibrio harveyi]|uniref:hypothetical protein n=1 Tax=Vibrio TaxID=662 RepID=UPI0022CD9C6D|nr:hypothetical protein [Vibrio sp. NFR]MDA0135858.1 hypothetical protein [Vibrio sp. NFR]
MSIGKSSTAKYRVWEAIVVFFILSLLSFTLFYNAKILELTFVVFVFISILTSFSILFLDRLKLLKFKEFQLTLAEIKETEASVRDIALVTAEVARAIENETLTITDGTESKIIPKIEKLESLVK